MRSSKAKAFAATSVLVLFTSLVNAAQPACKGMVENACSTTNACTWVSSYERKNGVKINGYCRNKAKKSSAKKAMSDRKKSADLTGSAANKTRS